MSTSDQTPQPHDETPSAFFGGDVVRGLAQLRDRLLDLTARNGLLNFRHSRRGALRVIDDAPDLLWDRLVERNLEMRFVPIPKPQERNEPEFYPGQVVTGPDGTIVDMEPADTRVEDEARKLGISTDYDLLPLPPGERRPVARKRPEDAIQALLFPDDLDATLAALHTRARADLEESGLNVLHVAFGFLEWAEASDAESKMLAPLLLVPVRLSRSTI